ncbi:MAG TPA: oxygenase MpaB family protein [Rugosimonospora sp.]|nr:oxygenase MpaB family protein [Rugosimonospora sp.]
MVAFPQRFRETEALNRRAGRALRLVAGVREPDPALLDTIGARLLCRDEVGAALVRAMRAGTVTMAQFRQALDGGTAPPPDAPEPLRAFFAAVEATPDWVDFDRVNEGARVARRFGTNGSDVLLQLALIGSYRYGGPSDLLVATGGLTGGSAVRRLAETQHWAVAVTGPDAMRRTGAGFRLTVQVRLMHAMVNQRFETGGRWDTARWGLPVNQADQAATLGLFSGVQLLGVRLLGVRVSRAESGAFMHLWRYVGWLLGVDEDWLCRTEREQHRHNYHQLLTQSYGGAAGPPLAGALVAAQRTLHFGHFAGVRGRYARARLLSMLRYFLGKGGVRDLGLPVSLPWAVPPIVAANLLRYQLLARTPAGRAYLERWGDRSAQRQLRRYFGTESRELGLRPLRTEASAA